MKSQSTIIKVPGKLFVAGEYAVLEPENSGIIMAVNRYITVKVTPSKEYGIASSQQKAVLHWDYSKEGGVSFKDSESLPSFTSPFILMALDTAFQYLEIRKIPLETFYIEITSQLDDEKTGKKYGLGSSAAIIVGIITAILDYFNILGETDYKTRFYLSAIAHLKVQKGGSCADIAASVYGGWIWFKSFSVPWLLEKLERLEKAEGVEEILKTPWPGLEITPLTPPPDLHFYAGWTGEVVRTANMINQVLELKNQNPKSYKHFIDRSSQATKRMIDGFLNQNTKNIIEAAGESREALLYLGQESGADIETKELKKLCDIGDIYGRGKPSGAGGGDCGIVLTNQEVKDILWRAWEEEGIQPLDLTCGKGV